MPNNGSVFVGISESRPHCTDRISRDPHTRCAVTSSVTWRRQSHVLRELRYERPKKSIEWVEMHVLFFAVCGAKFTKFGVHVGEWLQFSTPFSDRRYLVPVRRYSRSKREIRNFDVFGPKIFWGRDPQFSDSILKITVTAEHVAKFGDDRPRNLRDWTAKKSMIETTAAFYNGGPKKRKRVLKLYK